MVEVLKRDQKRVCGDGQFGVVWVVMRLEGWGKLWPDYKYIL